jgi:hypothetical protein
MRIRRRNRPEAGGGLLPDDRPPIAETIGSTVVHDIDVVVARLQVLDVRVGALEARLADTNEAAAVMPDQDDVLDAQVRSARLAAELHLAALELRAELQRLRPAAAASDVD